MDLKSSLQLHASRLAQSTSGRHTLAGIKSILAGPQLSEQDKARISELLCSGWQDSNAQGAALAAVQAAIDGVKDREPRVVLNLALDRETLALARDYGKSCDASWDDALAALIHQALTGQVAGV